MKSSSAVAETATTDTTDTNNTTDTTTEATMCDRCPTTTADTTDTTTAEATTVTDTTDTTDTTTAIEAAAAALADGDIAAAVTALSTDTTAEAETTTTETEAAPTCDTCGNDESDCECYDCDECRERHDPHDRPICESCHHTGRWRRRTVCADRCDRCFWCEACGESHDSHGTTRCDNCSQCIDNHDCNYCESCSEYTDDSVCGDCNQCDSCGCSCTPERGVDLVKNPLRFHRGKGVPEFPSTRFAGPEIEVAECDHPSRGISPTNVVVDRWSASIVEDGSLPDSGFEIKPAPASGGDFVRQIDEIIGALKTQNAVVNAQCGLHVHVNTQDYRWRDWSKLLWLYAFLEDAIYSLVPASRRSAHWCVQRGASIREVFEGGPKPSWSDTGHKSRVMAVAGCHGLYRPTEPTTPRRQGWMDEQDWANAQQNHASQVINYEAAMAAYLDRSRTGVMHRHAEVKRVKAVTRNRRRGAYAGTASGGRYYGLNLQAMFVHGTVEIRIHGGTVERDKIIAWSALWANLVDFAKKSSLDEINEIARGDDPWAALMRIAPEHWRPYYSARRAKFER